MASREIFPFATTPMQTDTPLFSEEGYQRAKLVREASQSCQGLPNGKEFHRLQIMFAQLGKNVWREAGLTKGRFEDGVLHRGAKKGERERRENEMRVRELEMERERGRMERYEEKTRESRVDSGLAFEQVVPEGEMAKRNEEKEEEGEDDVEFTFPFL